VLVENGNIYYYTDGKRKVQLNDELMSMDFDQRWVHICFVWFFLRKFTYFTSKKSFLMSHLFK